MLHNIISICRAYPEILIFLAISIGYLVGKLKIAGVTIGATAGVLITALLLGQVDVTIPPILKNFAFALFIFCIGYRVGPDFFGAIKKDGIKYIFLSVTLCIVAVTLSVIIAKIFHFDPGTTAGLFGGALTQSAVLGVAIGAVQTLNVAPEIKTFYETNVVTAYAITYIFGTVGFIFFLKIALRVMKINFKREAQKLEETLEKQAEQDIGFVSSESTTSDLFASFNRLNARAYRVTQHNIIGKTISDLPALFGEKIIVDRLQRDTLIFTPDGKTIIEANDVLAIIASRKALLNANDIIGKEIVDQDVLNSGSEVAEICILNAAVVGMTIDKLNNHLDYKCFVRRIMRQGNSLPMTKSTLIKKCDILQIETDKKDLAKIIKYLGFQEKPVGLVDMVMIGIGSVMGILFGMITVKVAGIPLSISSGVGVLLFGLLFGWARSYHPRFGQISTSAQWIFTDLGLNLFIICVGLTAAPKALHAILQGQGLLLFGLGTIITIVPVFVTLLVGKYLFKLTPILLFGAISGAKSNTASLNVLKEEAESFSPVLGYIVPYTISNIILTISGALIIYLS
jgi:putative transport protein